MSTMSHPRLSPAEVAEFRREGFIIEREPVLLRESFERLSRQFDDMLAELPPGVRPESMDVPHFVYPELFEWLFADDVLDLVEPIVGPDIALWSSHFLCKPKGDGKRVPWHEDSAYWGDMLKPMEVVTVWLAIDPSTRENGCMHVVPRTHDNGYSDYEPVDATLNVFGTEIKKSQRYDASAVAIELEPNQASLHDGKLVHGSPPNNSTIRRCGYTMRYIGTHVRFNYEKYPYHQIYLARGRDLAGNRYGDPTKSYHDLMDRRGNRLKGH